MLGDVVSCGVYSAGGRTTCGGGQRGRTEELPTPATEVWSAARLNSRSLMRRSSQRRLACFAPPSGCRIVTVANGMPVLVRESVARESHLAMTGKRADGSSGDLTGLRVWEAAPYLIRHLERNQERYLQDRLVLDVGSGTGAVGLASAALGAKHSVLSDADSTATISTDCGWQESSVLRTLSENVALNPAHVQAAVSVEHLRWGDRSHIDALRARWPSGFDTIVASDILYYKPEETYDTLAYTIRELAADGARGVLSYMVRHGAEHTFVDLLESGSALGCMDSQGSIESDSEQQPTSQVVFNVVYRNAADEFSRTDTQTFAPRIVELERVPG